jgi:hypothetical protein
VEVFHLALLEVVGETDIVMRREQQAGPFALEPPADGRDFLRVRPGTLLRIAQLS